MVTHSLRQKVVREAVTPILSQFDRLDQWMIVVRPMLASVSVDRVVTTANSSAIETGSQMDPGAAHVDTWLADVRTRISGFEILKVITCWRTHPTQPLDNGLAS